MKGARTLPANRPRVCGDCTAYTDGVCSKGGGIRTAGAKGCSWGLRRGAHDKPNQRGLF